MWKKAYKLNWEEEIKLSEFEIAFKRKNKDKEQLEEKIQFYKQN